MTLDFRSIVVAVLYACIVAVAAVLLAIALGGNYYVGAIIGGAFYGLTVARFVAALSSMPH